MQKSFLLLLLGLQHIFLYGQDQPELRYFRDDASSLIGVKSANGRIIIPARYEDYDILPDKIDFKRPVKGQIIMLQRREEHPGANRSVPAHAWGDAFDRNGKLLFHPMNFDLGPDPYCEGMTRCVEAHKAGFADQEGNILIPPVYDWVSTFQYGYAIAYNGCSLDWSKDAEHPAFIFAADADTFYLNRRGAKITPSEKPSSAKDQLFMGRYLPYPFSYSPSERKLLDSMEAQEAIHKIAFCNYYPRRDGKANRIQFEITGRDQDSSFTITGFEWTEGTYSAREDLLFMVDRKGGWWHIDPYQGNSRYKSWLKRQLHTCHSYFIRNPDAPNRFDTERY